MWYHHVYAVKTLNIVHVAVKMTPWYNYCKDDCLQCDLSYVSSIAGLCCL